MRKLLVLSVIAVTMVATSTAQAQTLRLPHKPFSNMTRHQKISYLKRQVFHDHSIIRFWKNHQQLVTAQAKNAVHWAHVSLRIAGKSLHRLLAVHRLVGGDLSAWYCIHSYEGSWTDPNPPYWGGLQMDLSFQTTYGPEFYRRWGTADHWPVWAQITAARRARAVRGYGPWPNTAALCGLN